MTSATQVEADVDLEVIFGERPHVARVVVAGMVDDETGMTLVGIIARLLSQGNRLVKVVAQKGAADAETAAVVRRIVESRCEQVGAQIEWTGLPMLVALSPAN